jgi:hypothetical protein
VPPWAAANSPGRSALAPVKAPRRLPNSSLSARASGSAPQLTGTNGPALPLSACSWRAISSLPAPLSPAISTGTAAGATCWRLARRRCIASEVP